MFGQVQGTPYDITFGLFGIPVRVHVLFWLGAVIIGWDPENPAFLISNIICIFVSILVHELGHSLVTRYFGFKSTEIWLYLGGGFATTNDHGTWKNILVLLAGPGFGLLFFAFILGLTFVLPDEFVQHELFSHMLWVLLFINLFWSLFNLLPIWPMDGSQITRNLFYYFNRRQGEQYAMLFSIATCVIAAIFLRSLGLNFTMMLLVYFGVMSYQEYQRLKAPGRWH